MALIKGKQLADAPDGITTSKINNNAVTAAKVDATVIVAAGTNPFTGDQSLGGNKATNVGTPTVGTDAANKNYVDNLVNGLKVKQPALTSSITNVALAGEQTLDGVLTAASRVLLLGQTSAIENGLWVTAAGAWTRPADFAAGASAAGSFIFVEEGTVRADTGWVCTTDPPNDIIGTNNLTFAQFSAGSFGIPVDVGLANAAGASASQSRADHVHRAPIPITDNQDMTCSATAADGQIATATVLVKSNFGGLVEASVNGVMYDVGNGVKTKAAYISGDGGATARAFGAVVAGDSIYWNGSIAGFQLAATDKIGVKYLAFY